jgi:UDP-N-acetylmuramate dehydrogenase
MKLHTINPFAELAEIVIENEPLAPYTWYRIGGPARWFIRPRSLEELQDVVARANDADIKTYVLGLGANLLVSDAGVDGAVIKLDQDYWRRAKIDGTSLEVGAGVDMQKLILRTVRAGLAGIETLAGIPGTIGGGIRMNAGGKYGDIGSRVSRVTVMAQDGTVFDRLKDDLLFEYRSTNIAAPFILEARLELEQEDPDELMRRTKEIWMFKKNSQPLNTKSAGCMFKNPRGLSAGALIDQAGLKGFRVGGAEVSTKHANFIIAHPNCSADDVLRIVKIIKEKVSEKFEVNLETEVKLWA